jgi:hypothetical protein
MDRAIAELGKALRDSMQKLSVCFDQLLDVVSGQEERLQRLEGSFSQDLRTQLRALEGMIEGMRDPERKTRAMALFATLCSVLGVEDLED